MDCSFGTTKPPIGIALRTTAFRHNRKAYPGVLYKKTPAPQILNFHYSVLLCLGSTRSTRSCGRLTAAGKWPLRGADHGRTNVEQAKPRARYVQCGTVHRCVGLCLGHQIAMRVTLGYLRRSSGRSVVECRRSHLSDFKRALSARYEGLANLRAECAGRS